MAAIFAFVQEKNAKVFERLALWRDPVARDGPEQMACDEVLLGLAELPAMRVFRWWRPWVSAGYFVEMDSARKVRPDLPVCRRWTGGGIVVHEGDFTFSLSVPKSEALAYARPAESYRTIHLGLAEALGLAGASAELACTAEPAPGECFAAPVEHDVVSNGRKIAGGAQRRTRNGLLHQGSVQLGKPFDPDFALLFAQALASSVERWTPPADFEERVQKLTADKYALPDFLSGRTRPMNFTAAASS